MKTAWNIWNVFPEITPVLKALLMLRDADDICLDAIERFAILSYDCPSSLCKVDKVKQGLFTREARSLERIPPTQASLLHVKRGVFQ